LWTKLWLWNSKCGDILCLVGHDLLITVKAMQSSPQIFVLAFHYCCAFCKRDKYHTEHWTNGRSYERWRGTGAKIVRE
jgi:hypothetical protein